MYAWGSRITGGTHSRHRIGNSCICIFYPVSTAPSSSFAFFHGGLSDKAQYLRRRNRIIVESVHCILTKTRYQKRQGGKRRIGGRLVCILVDHGTFLSLLYKKSGAPGAVPSSQREPDWPFTKVHRNGPLTERRTLFFLMPMYFHLISRKCNCSIFFFKSSWLWIESVECPEGFTLAVY